MLIERVRRPRPYLLTAKPFWRVSAHISHVHGLVNLQPCVHLTFKSFKLLELQNVHLIHALWLLHAHLVLAGNFGTECFVILLSDLQTLKASSVSGVRYCRFFTLASGNTWSPRRTFLTHGSETALDRRPPSCRDQPASLAAPPLD